MILDCGLQCTNTSHNIRTELDALSSHLQGQKYAFVDERDLGLGEAVSGGSIQHAVWSWLNAQMID